MSGQDRRQGKGIVGVQSPVNLKNIKYICNFNIIIKYIFYSRSKFNKVRMGQSYKKTFIKFEIIINF